MKAGRRAIVTITTRAGVVHSENTTLTPMTADELSKKFKHLVGVRLGAEKAMRLDSELKSLAQAASVRPLMGALNQ